MVLAVFGRISSNRTVAEIIHETATYVRLRAKQMPPVGFPDDVADGSKAEKLQLSKCFPLFSQQRTFCIRRRHVADCEP